MKGADGVCLKEKPLSIEESFNLSEVEEDGGIEVFLVGKKPLVVKEDKIL